MLIKAQTRAQREAQAAALQAPPKRRTVALIETKPKDVVEFWGEEGVLYEVVRVGIGYTIVKGLAAHTRKYTVHNETVKSEKGHTYKVPLAEPKEIEIVSRPKGEMVSSGSRVYVVDLKEQQQQ